LFDDLPDLPDALSDPASEPVGPPPPPCRIPSRRRRRGRVFPGIIVLVLVAVTWHPAHGTRHTAHGTRSRQQTMTKRSQHRTPFCLFPRRQKFSEKEMEKKYRPS
jgi:hypothetical protein